MAKIEKDDFEIRDNGPDLPPHFAAWGWGPECYDRFQASFTLAAERRLREDGVTIRGCPLGRGKSPAKAVADLIRRTNAESGTRLSF